MRKDRDRARDSRRPVDIQREAGCGRQRHDAHPVPLPDPRGRRRVPAVELLEAAMARDPGFECFRSLASEQEPLDVDGHLAGISRGPHEPFDAPRRQSAACVPSRCLLEERVARQPETSDATPIGLGPPAEIRSATGRKTPLPPLDRTCHPARASLCRPSTSLDRHPPHTSSVERLAPSANGVPRPRRPDRHKGGTLW